MSNSVTKKGITSARKWRHGYKEVVELGIPNNFFLTCPVQSIREIDGWRHACGGAGEPGMMHVIACRRYVIF